jgi:hypothetical protein
MEVLAGQEGGAELGGFLQVYSELIKRLVHSWILALELLK